MIVDLWKPYKVSLGLMALIGHYSVYESLCKALLFDFPNDLSSEIWFELIEFAILYLLVLY